jgi:hypothetical protein
MAETRHGKAKCKSKDIIGRNNSTKEKQEQLVKARINLEKQYI